MIIIANIRDCLTVKVGCIYYACASIHATLAVAIETVMTWPPLAVAAAVADDDEGLDAGCSLQSPRIDTETSHYATVVFI